MGSFNNTDNLGNKLNIGDHIGYVFGNNSSHYRIHSGIIVKLCPKAAWVQPDEDFLEDSRHTKDELFTEEFVSTHPNHKYSARDTLYLAPYGRIVKLGY